MPLLDFKRFSSLAVLSLVGLLSATGWSSVSAQDQSNDSAWFEQESEWHGFTRRHFKVAERNAYVVLPKEAKEGSPWVWRARFPDYHPKIDIELLKVGFHIAYVDVAGLFGSPTATKIGDQFYEFMVNERGLSKQVCLEGVSRGGLFVYNWAALHPERVACIYCDTPVCDFKSWPAGKGKGLGSTEAWKQCLSSYGFDEEEALAFEGNPIDSAKVVADAKIPLMHIVSENDQVVPPIENTYLLKKRLEEHEHTMKIISVAEGTEKSNGHHFDHPAVEQVVEFILASTRSVENE